MSYGDWTISARKRWLWGLFSALALLALAALAIAALIATIDGNGFALIVLALSLAGAYLCGRACARIPSVSLRIDPEQVTIVGPLRTIHVLAHHAEMFCTELRPTLFGNQPTIVLRYDTYRSIPLWLFTAFSSAARADEQATELNQRAEALNETLAKAKTGTTPSSISA